jgi:hypothetical protein
MQCSPRLMGERMRKVKCFEWRKWFKERIACLNHKWRQCSSLYSMSRVVFIPRGQTVNWTYYVEKLKRLREAVCRKCLEVWPKDWIHHHDNAPAHKALSVKQFLAQKSITEMEHPPCSPDLASNDVWLFPKIKSVLKGRRFQYTESIKNKCRRHWSLFHDRISKNVFNSDSIIGLNA